MEVDILDVGVGNTRSIDHVLKRLGLSSNFVHQPSDLSSETLIIPGVGSAYHFMAKIRKADLKECLIERAGSGKRIIGICLGFQMLGQYSEEDGGVEGLGILSGYAERLSSNGSHNGWEPYRFDRSNLSHTTSSSLTRKRVLTGRVFYNHEFGFINKDSCYEQKIPGCLHKYSSLLIKDNIIGIQFHPEKSQTTGLNLFSMLL